MDFLLRTSYLNWTERKERVNKLAVLEQILEGDNKLLEGVIIRELDGCFDYHAGIFVHMFVVLRMYALS
jgi:hypothetical protein